jgi:hypothetical protein
LRDYDHEVELAELVAHHHDTIVDMFAERARQACAVGSLTRVELVDAVPFFLDGLVESLTTQAEHPDPTAAGADHGSERLQVGFHIDEVVREYFILAACILETAEREAAAPTARELRLLLRAIGDGAAAAATEYMQRREADLVRREATHAGFLAHEVHSSLAGARLGFDLLRRRELQSGGELVRVVDDNLRRAAQQVEQSLLGQRLTAVGVTRTPVLLRRLIDDVVQELHAQIAEKELVTTVSADEALSIEADVRLLRSALANLVGNAVKFTSRAGHVSVRAVVNGGTVAIEVEDGCGGLPPSVLERMFQPFTQVGDDRSGVGLGLTIARAAVEAQGGTLSARDVPEHGCVFTLTMPRLPQPG